MWGLAKPGTIVQVGMDGLVVGTLVNGNGEWSTELDTLVAGGPYELQVVAGDTITLHDIMVGEVWLGVGAINVGGPSKKPGRGSNPLVRVLTVSEKKNDSMSSVAHSSGWQESDSLGIGDCPPEAWSFASELQRRLGVPIGLIACMSEDDTIGSWSPSLTRGRSDDTTKTKMTGLHQPKLGPRLAWGREVPGTLFRQLIEPLIPFRIRGVIWDESKGTVFREEGRLTAMSSLIDDWSARWFCGDLPCLVLHRLPGDLHIQNEVNWHIVDETQELFSGAPRIAATVVVATMVGRGKRFSQAEEEGHRLALLARKRIYREHVEDTGPTFRSMMVSNGSAVVRFNHADGGLQSFPGSQVRGFMIAGEDRVFFPADASILSGTIIVSSLDVPRPVAVRYGWEPDSFASLCSREILPAVPFRTDRWNDAKTGIPHEKEFFIKKLRFGARRSKTGKRD